MGNKINKKAFQAHMQRNIRQAAMRERMKKKLASKPKINSKPQPPKKTKKVIESTWLPENYTLTERSVRRKKKKKKKKG